MLVYRILWLIRTVLLAILIVNVAIVTDEYEVDVVAVLDRQWMNCYHKKNFFFSGIVGGGGILLENSPRSSFGADVARVVHNKKTGIDTTCEGVMMSLKDLKLAIMRTSPKGLERDWCLQEQDEPG